MGLKEVYTFTVGYHELTGSKISLKKPLLVLKKTRSVDEDQSSDTKSGNAELEVIGIIRQRILFKTRPKALISSKFLKVGWILKMLLRKKKLKQ